MPLCTRIRRRRPGKESSSDLRGPRGPIDLDFRPDLMGCAATHSSRIQLPTDTPPQLMPPTKLPARDSRRPLSRPDPDIEMGFVPFPHCAVALVIESLRGGGALNTPSPLPGCSDMLPVRSPLPALWSADVRFDACCPGGDTEVVCRVVMSIGAAPDIVKDGRQNAGDRYSVVMSSRSPHYNARTLSAMRANLQEPSGL